MKKQEIYNIELMAIEKEINYLSDSIDKLDHNLPETTLLLDHYDDLLMQRSRLLLLIERNPLNYKRIS